MARGKEGAKAAAGGGGGKKAGGAGSWGNVTNGDLLDLDQAVAMLKTTRPTFYRWLRAGKFKGMKVGRQWRFYRKDLNQFLKGQEPEIELTADISPLLAVLAQGIEEAGGAVSVEAEHPQSRLAAERMIRLGIALHASDIHLAPQLSTGSGPNTAVIRYRIDGTLHSRAELDARLLPALIEQWKALSGCDRQEKSKSQDGRMLFEAGERRLDLRVNFLPTATGESMTAKILDPSEAIAYLSLDRIGLATSCKERLKKWIASPWGMIVVSGSTGSGKTTTLYASLKEVATAGVKTITIEDPVEFLFPWMSQVQVNPASGMDFATAARAALRSDPDIVMIGEIRDRETCRLSQQIALTGHLVFTSLHAPRAARALIRLAEVGQDMLMPGEAVKFVLAQNLVRRLCPDCAREAKPQSALLDSLREAARRGGLNPDEMPAGFLGPVGCAKCGQTGYRRREAVSEGLEVSPEIAACLRRGADEAEIERVAVSQGMVTLAADGYRLAAEGVTSLEEVLRVLGTRQS